MVAETDSQIRIALGEISANALLSNDSYLVTNWTRTSDMANTSFTWSASQAEKGLQQEFVAGLGKGSGGYYGGYSGTLNFFVATPQMRQYLFETLMNFKPIARVTAYLHVPNAAYDFEEMQVVTCDLISPIASNADSDYTRFNNTLYHTMQYRIERAELVDYTLLVDEAGNYIVDEAGNYISIES